MRFDKKVRTITSALCIFNLVSCLLGYGCICIATVSR